MATPSTAINRFDLSISFGEFSTALNRKGFIGMQVLTPIAVALQTAEFLRLPVEALLTPIEDTRRAPKAGYKRDDFEWDTDSYKTHEHGVEEEIDDRTIAMYGSEIRADRIHAERVVNRLAIAYEQEVAQAVFNATTWSSYTTALTTPWSTKDTADPIADIDAAVEAVSSQCGHEPNALILTEFAFKKMIRTARIEDLLKYSGIDDPKSLSDSQMSELLQVPQIIRAKGYYNSGNLGGDASFTPGSGTRRWRWSATCTTRWTWRIPSRPSAERSSGPRKRGRSPVRTTGRD